MNTPKTIHIVPVGDQYQLQISGTGFSPYRVGVPACFKYKQSERAYLLQQGGYILPAITVWTEKENNNG